MPLVTSRRDLSREDGKRSLNCSNRTSIVYQPNWINLLLLYSNTFKNARDQICSMNVLKEYYNDLWVRWPQWNIDWLTDHNNKAKQKYSRIWYLNRKVDQKCLGCVTWTESKHIVDDVRFSSITRWQKRLQWIKIEVIKFSGNIIEWEAWSTKQLLMAKQHGYHNLLIDKKPIPTVSDVAAAITNDKNTKLSVLNKQAFEDINRLLTTQWNRAKPCFLWLKIAQTAHI